MDSLFDPADTEAGTPSAPDTAPLAARMRPTTLDEFVGQEHLLELGLGACAPRSSRASRTR